MFVILSERCEILVILSERSESKDLHFAFVIPSERSESKDLHVT
jgi:hypothetical protein